MLHGYRKTGVRDGGGGGLHRICNVACSSLQNLGFFETYIIQEGRRNPPEDFLFTLTP